MTTWLEFPPNRLTAIKNAYLGQHVRGTDNPDEDEKIQDTPMIDATGTRMMIGSSRLDATKADNLRIGNSPWLVIHPVFPVDWQYPP